MKVLLMVCLLLSISCFVIAVMSLKCTMRMKGELDEK